MFAPRCGWRCARSRGGRRRHLAHRAIRSEVYTVMSILDDLVRIERAGAVDLACLDFFQEREALVASDLGARWSSHLECAPVA